MEPSAPRRRHWFPIFKLSLFLVVFASVMYFTLELFNPHTDSEELQLKGKTRREKQIEFLMQIFKTKK
jgi:hypothetical protein